MLKKNSMSMIAALAVVTLSGCPATPPTSAGGFPRATSDAYPSPATSAYPTTAPSGAAVPPSQQQTSLKAGAIDDNAKFSDYLTYLQRYTGPTMRPLNVANRRIIQVTDAEGHSVSNADVTVSQAATGVFSGKTYANGELVFVPATEGEYTVTVAKGDDKQTQTFAQGDTWAVKLPKSEAKPAPRLDVCFLIDTTGSMGGEIARLQSTISGMSTRIKALDGQPSVRFGLLAYRDQGDDYLTRKTEFTDDLGAFQSALNGLSAGGGGDTPEDMESGLAEAVNNLGWDSGDTVRLTFLVADAEPHLNYPQTVPYTTTALKAVSKGIKIFPIGCSGLPPQGEYMMRQLAQLTMSQYLFITRGGDESTGGGDVSHTVDKFQEGRLDDIVVDIVKAELDSLGK